MPAYYFHFRDSGALIKDPDGINLPDPKGVRWAHGSLGDAILQQVDKSITAAAKRAGKRAGSWPFDSTVGRPRKH